MRPARDSDAAVEAMRCEECGGLTRCSGEEHRYWNAAMAAQPAKTLSPLWRDPMIGNTNTKNEETSE